MAQSDDILLLGLGTEGTLAASYLSQRRPPEHLRLLGIHDREDEQSVSTGIRCVRLPEPPFTPSGLKAKESQDALSQLLDEECPQLKMLCILAFLEESFVTYYAPLTMLAAFHRSIPATLFAVLPHSRETEEVRRGAETALETLRSQNHEVITFNRDRFEGLFPRQDDLEQQMRTWLTDTALGYLNLLSQPPAPPPDGTESEAVLTRQELNAMPTGIFAQTKPTYFQTLNLDIPTYLRKHIQPESAKLEKEKSLIP